MSAAQPDRRVVQALTNCATDLYAYPTNEGIVLLVADRITRLTAELAKGTS